MNNIKTMISELINMLKTIESTVKKEYKIMILIDSSKKHYKRKPSDFKEPIPKNSCHHYSKERP